MEILVIKKQIPFLNKTFNRNGRKEDQNCYARAAKSWQKKMKIVVIFKY